MSNVAIIVFRHLIPLFHFLSYIYISFLQISAFSYYIMLHFNRRNERRHYCEIKKLKIKLKESKLLYCTKIKQFS